MLLCAKEQHITGETQVGSACLIRMLQYTEKLP